MRDMEALAPIVRGDVLDVGGSNGNRYRSLFHFGSYTTLDINGEADIQASSDHIPLKSGMIDTILCIQLFHYFIDPLPHLKEMRRVLKPGGKLILSVPKFIALHSTTRCTFTTLAIRELCMEAGFKVLETRNRGRLPSAIVQTILRALCNKLDPYHNRRSMYLMAPLSLILTKAAIFLDRFFKDEMFSMGFILVLE